MKFSEIDEIFIEMISDKIATLIVDNTPLQMTDEPEKSEVIMAIFTLSMGKVAYKIPGVMALMQQDLDS